MEERGNCCTLKFTLIKRSHKVTEQIITTSTTEEQPPD